jgi:hypothetical protein
MDESPISRPMTGRMAVTDCEEDISLMVLTASEFCKSGSAELESKTASAVD